MNKTVKDRETEKSRERTEFLVWEARGVWSSTGDKTPSLWTSQPPKTQEKSHLPLAIKVTPSGSRPVCGMSMCLNPVGIIYLFLFIIYEVLAIWLIVIVLAASSA